MSRQFLGGHISPACGVSTVDFLQWAVQGPGVHQRHGTCAGQTSQKERDGAQVVPCWQWCLASNLIEFGSLLRLGPY